MSKINSIIPAQNFELVRDRIGAILALELANQFVLTSDNSINAKVYVERNLPVDREETPVIIIKYAGGNLNSKHQGVSDHEASFFIDVYHSAKTDLAQSGGYKSASRCQHLVGLCRFILENPQYYALGFARPFIEETSVEKIEILELKEPDSVNLAFARITYKARFNETNTFVEPIEVLGYDTVVKLHETEKGFLYEIDNQ